MGTDTHTFSACWRRSTVFSTLICVTTDRPPPTPAPSLPCSKSEIHEWEARGRASNGSPWKVSAPLGCGWGAGQGVAHVHRVAHPVSAPVFGQGVGHPEPPALDSPTSPAFGPECMHDPSLENPAQNCARWPRPSEKLRGWWRATRRASPLAVLGWPCLRARGHLFATRCEAVGSTWALL